ncbi:MAG TPA: Rrf2 family transcriptional regulator [Gemmatimonadales bacterium]|nr:Rrf2 family transcriptional regulator [Gemmatimonadales bacterium]
MLTQASECAIRAACELARAEPGSWVGAGHLARRLHVSPTYLAKILQVLAREGVLASQRGKAGGFKLQHPASRIRLFDLVAPFDELTPGRRCLLGYPVCSDATACPAHDRWKEVGEKIATFFRQTTLAQLL